MNDIYTIKEFEKKNRKKKHIIFICDHASNYIPKQYDYLGLKEKHTLSHIAYDIGAREICTRLAKYLNQSCFLSNFSRLVIDPNRSEYSNELILSTSANVKIPGNFNINLEEKKKRLNNFHQKYHLKLQKFIEKKQKKYKKVFLISIHSFTKKFGESQRGVEIGLLWNKNMNLLIPIQQKLSAENIYYGRNFPYSGFHFNYTLDRHSRNGEIDNICIEFRNDLICSKKRIKKYINIFGEIFFKLLE